MARHLVPRRRCTCLSTHWLPLVRAGDKSALLIGSLCATASDFPGGHRLVVGRWTCVCTCRNTVACVWLYRTTRTERLTSKVSRHHHSWCGCDTLLFYSSTTFSFYHVLIFKFHSISFRVCVSVRLFTQSQGLLHRCCRLNCLCVVSMALHSVRCPRHPLQLAGRCQQRYFLRVCQHFRWCGRQSPIQARAQELCPAH